MTEHDYVGASILEHGADGAVEDGSCRTAFLAANVNAFVVERDIVQSCHRIVSVVAYDAVAARDGHGEPPLVVGEVAGEFGVGAGVVGSPHFGLGVFFLRLLGGVFHMSLGRGQLGLGFVGCSFG